MAAKKSLGLVALAAAAALGLAFASCDSGTGGGAMQDVALVGTWGSGAGIITFSDDGTGSYGNPRTFVWESSGANSVMIAFDDTGCIRMANWAVDSSGLVFTNIRDEAGNAATIGSIGNNVVLAFPPGQGPGDGGANANPALLQGAWVDEIGMVWIFDGNILRTYFEGEQIGGTFTASDGILSVLGYSFPFRFAGNNTLIITFPVHPDDQHIVGSEYADIIFQRM